MRFMKKAVFLFFIFIPLSLFSDDGMWMPHQMKKLNLNSLGLKMNPDDLYKKDGSGLMSAVVSLGGGTGEFVSAGGLILTNHHVAFGALQRASSTEQDLITEGFIARTKEEEIPAQGYIADVLIGYEEVTRAVLAGVKKDMSYREKYDRIEANQNKRIAKGEKAGPDIRCTLASMYDGNHYYLFKYKRLKDIRIVYAPPRDLGNFGGEVDNWMWPRHTCDFAFLRAYVSRDNAGADYRRDNVPYHPKSVMKIAREPLREGDFTFVMGYPGRTYRNNSSYEVEGDIRRLKDNIGQFQDLIAFYEEAGRNNKEVEIKYAGRVKGLYNSMKNYQGKLEGFGKISLMEKKKAQEDELAGWIQDNNKRMKQYGRVLRDLRNFTEAARERSERNELVNGLVSGRSGSTLVGQAYTIVRAVEERQKPDMERESAYQDRNFDRLKQGVKLAERGYDFETDRALLKHQMKKWLSERLERIPEVLKDLYQCASEADIGRFVDSLYDRTKLRDPEKRLALLEASPEALAAEKDPMIDLVWKLEEELKTGREEGKARSQEFLEIRREYMKALLGMKEGRIAPDANGTIRFTYGNVEGYRPKDAVFYKPFTTFKGVIEKDTGEFPFRVPERMKTLFEAKDFGPYADPVLGDVPACFLNTTNVTGGNSGSPTLNAKGEQVGIIFDMTYESVTGDYYVIPDLQRTISVDIRYVLFVTDRFSGAKHILKEMGIE